jgi:DNA mismatch repair protein MutS2
VVFVRTESNTLDLRGHRVDEALAKLERFLDQSSLSTSSPVMIIHGHGTGAIKSAVREYLRASNYASTFRPGEVYEGGDGVTVVDLS